MQDDQNIASNRFTHKWDSTLEYEYASTWKRLTNYLVDTLFVYALLLMLSIAFVYHSKDDLQIQSFIAVEKPLLVFLLVLYYTFCETYFRGRTLGKLVTHTKAITEENTNLNIQHAFVRSILRLIPFNHLSFLFGENNDSHEYSIGWHDKISKTRVIDLKRVINSE
jgi:uncharacterized RDD family membrane protein YckC